MRIRTLLLTGTAAALLAACGDPNQLPDPTDANIVDTVTIFALSDTIVSNPSAFQISERARAIRTDLSSDFDFAYDIDPALGPVLIPAQVTEVIPPSAANAGFQRMVIAFDSIFSAKSNGYVVDEVFTADSGDVFLARSGVRCSIGVPLYAKLEILGVDSVAKSVTFQFMVNKNCGYRGLEPGLPSD